MTDMPPCPYCGLKSGFTIRGKMAGPATSIYDENGIYTELDMDKAFWKHQTSKTIRCEECGKIRKDVYLFDRTEIRVKNG